MKRVYLAIIIVASLVLLSEGRAQALLADITFTYPAEGDTLRPEPVMIRVEAQGTFAYPIIYEITTDGGEAWIQIEKDSGAGVGWIGNFLCNNVPDVSTNNSQLRVRTGDGAVGYSGKFSIIEIPKIRKVYVNSEEFPVPTNSDVIVEWDVTGEPLGIGLEYSVDHFATFRIELDLPADTRSYIWRTPSEEMSNVYFTVIANGGLSAEVGPFEIKHLANVPSRAGLSNGSLYPNPASRTLNIDHSFAGEIVVKVLSLSGTMLFELKEASNGLSAVDIASLPPGTYVAHVSSGEKVLSQTFTVVR